MIHFESVTKRFAAATALSDLSFVLPKGGVAGLLGPNGCGKTTALRLLLGLYLPDQGRVQVFGTPPNSQSSDRIGYLPEERGLYRRMTTTEVIRYYARLKNSRASPSEIDGWLDRLGISEFADQKVESLSKGTAQKVQFVATVVHRPQLLILDEPFSGLDPVSRELMRQAVLTLAGDGTTVLLSTHDMEIASRMCDTILMLNDGRKVLDGSLSEIFASFADDSIKLELDGAVPDLTGVLEVLDLGTVQELVLDAGVDPTDVLRELMSQTKLRRFELSTPSLGDIFLRMAKS